jgi:hypothetical protein
MSLNQAVQAHTRDFCESLILYGFRVGQAKSAPDLPPEAKFPKLSIRQLRSEIIEQDKSCLKSALQRFTTDYAHLSLDAGSFHGKSVLDFLILRTGSEHDTDFLLFQSFDVVKATLEFYKDTTASVIESLDSMSIKIHSIVGDGFSSQFQGLSPTSPKSIQNSDDYCQRLPTIRNIFYIYCGCHLLNLALHDALEASHALNSVDRYVDAIAKLLRKKEYWRTIEKRCPTFSQTRWCHAYLLCLFFAKNHQAILRAGLYIPNEVFAYGALLEPLFTLISEFESRKMRFWMRERKLATFFARLTALENKYFSFPFVAFHAKLLRLVVFVRFTEHNHDLSLLADALTWETKVSGFTRRIEPSLDESFMEKAMEAVLNDRAIAIAADDSDDSGDEDESYLEEEDENEGTSEAPEFTIRFDEYALAIALDELQAEADRRKASDDARGIFAIGSGEIREYGKRSGWTEELIAECIGQFARWIRTPPRDQAFVSVARLDQFCFWACLGTSSHWSALKDYADLIMSLPAAETENERVFSIRKYIIGDRSGRSKNDLVVARVRSKMERSRLKFGAVQ